VLLILLIWCLATFWAGRRDPLAGFWSGDPVFLDESGLEEFALKLGPPSRGGRAGSLLVASEEGALFSGEVIVAGGFGWRPWARSSREGAFTVRAKGGGKLPFPSALTFCIKNETLTISKGRKIYAFLGRDALASLEP